jgi:type VI secretion system secreted protein Hcp
VLKNARYALAVVFSMVVIGASGPAQADYFLKLTNIPGESKRDGHVDSIEILSFSLGFVRDSKSGTAARTGAGSCDGLIVKKQIDRASPPLLGRAMTGVSIPEGVLTARRIIEGETSDYFIVTMKDIIVTSVQQTDSGDPSRVVEEITMQARTYDFVYESAHRFGWDCSRNVAF